MRGSQAIRGGTLKGIITETGITSLQILSKHL